MKDETLVRRYAEGLAGALRTETEFAAVSRELEEFAVLLRENDGLRQALLGPFFATPKKMRIVEDVLAVQAGDPKTARFLLLLLRHKRLAVLPRILADLPAIWRERRGVHVFQVRSVVSLSESQRRRLEEELIRLEDGRVFCSYVLDPSIIGGLSIHRGNFVYDVSLKGQIERLKEHITER
jgi:F-type H+-transporting ATPase subunit delta